MQKILFFLAAILLCCCSADNEVKAETPDNTGNNSNTGKTLVVYYSYTGNSREIVNTLTSQIQADVLEIQPAEKGLKYEANNYALGTQLLEAIKANPNELSSYPAIDPVATSLSGYENIIIVTPLRLLPDVTWMGDALWINASNHSNRASLIEAWLKTLNFSNEESSMNKMYITIGGQTQSVTLVENAATRALVEKLKQGTVTVTLNSSGGFEIWGALGFSLPTSDQQMTAQPGDVILYNGSNICLFYGSNSWSYTRLGKIDGLSESELRTFLKAGESDISVTLSVDVQTDIRNIKGEGNAQGEGNLYSLNGQRVKNPTKGLYIRNGKKIAL